MIVHVFSRARLVLFITNIVAMPSRPVFFQPKGSHYFLPKFGSFLLTAYFQCALVECTSSGFRFVLPFSCISDFYRSGKHKCRDSVHLSLFLIGRVDHSKERSNNIGILLYIETKEISRC